MSVALSRRSTLGLGPRLVLLMGLALLPLALLAYVQVFQTQTLSDRRSEAAILGDTLMASAPVIERLTRAQGAAAALAATVALVDPQDPRCSAAIQSFLGENAGLFSFVAFIRPDGSSDCSSLGGHQQFDMTERLSQILASAEPLILTNPDGPISQTAILVVSHPVIGPDGVPAGAVTLSIPQTELADAAEALPDQPLALVAFSADGRILTSTMGLELAPGLLPAGADLARLAEGGGGQSFLARTWAGERRAFAVVPVVPGTAYIMGSWPAERLESSLSGNPIPAYLFPALMWAASLVVAWIATEYQVLRHVRSLRSAITAFAGGDRRLRPLHFETAAAELRDVGRAYEQMASSVVRNEAELEDIIHQKEVLLREVHHRVKNNLQLIASILNMQLRSVLSPETRTAMRSVQDRVLSLATIHREMYQTTGLADVRADEFLPQILRQLTRMAETPARRFELHSDIDDIKLTPDQSVPLALLLTEGVTNVIRFAMSPAGKPVSIDVTLKRMDDGWARLTLENPLIADIGVAPALTVDENADALGSQLVSAFARQLQGRMETERDGSRFRMHLEFPVDALQEGEERTAAARVAEQASTIDG